MFYFNLAHYSALASKILEEASSPNYFSGRVEIVTSSNVEVELVASLIIYRRKAEPFKTYDEGDTIEHISAVWWDFLCEDEEGTLEDDFDLEKFTEAMLAV